MALRGDLPAIMTRTRGINTPVVAQVVGSVLTIILLLANSSRATASLFTFIILLSTAAIVVVYSDRCARRAGNSTAAPASRFVVGIGHSVHHLRHVSAVGLEAGAWGLVLLAIGYGLRFDHASHQLERFDHPGEGGDSNRASGISRLSFLAKLLKHTSLVPSGPGL